MLQCWKHESLCPCWQPCATEWLLMMCCPHGVQTLTINPAKRDIESFSFDDFTLSGYNPHKKIAMQMAV